MLADRYKKNDFQDKNLKNFSALVAGCGGLGSGVIASLAGFGIGKIFLLDFDKVEMSNLNRQFIHNEKTLGLLKTQSASLWLQNYNSEIETSELDFCLDENNFSKIPKADIFFDCFDNIKSKLLLNKLAIKTNTPLIHGGVDGYSGQVTTIIPKKTACLECYLSENKNFEDKKPLSLAPCVNLVSSIEALEGLKILLGLEGALLGKIIKIDLKNNNFKTLITEKNPECAVCA